MLNMMWLPQVVTFWFFVIEYMEAQSSPKCEDFHEGVQVEIFNLENKTSQWRILMTAFISSIMEAKRQSFIFERLPEFSPNGLVNLNASSYNWHVNILKIKPLCWKNRDQGAED